MLENAVIKEYETSDVHVLATVRYEITPKTVILYIIPYLLFIGLMYGVFTQSSEPHTVFEQISTSLVLGSVFGTMFAATLYVSDYWKKEVPVYSVGLEGKTGTDYDRIINRSPTVVIVKTTSESDQAEVCKAAQRLEPVALQFDRNLAAIQQIADKCK
jgi:hypothetical protein